MVLQGLREFGVDVLVLAQDDYLILQEHVLVYPAEPFRNVRTYGALMMSTPGAGRVVSKGIRLDLLAIWVFWPRAVATAPARGLDDIKVCYWMYSCDKSSNLAIF